MSNPLSQLYRDRAESAAPAPELDQVMADVRSRIERRAHRRRTGLAAGGSVLAVTALAVGTVLVTTSDADGGTQAAGPAPQTSHSRRATSAVLDEPRSAPTTPSVRSTPVRTDGRLRAVSTPKKAPLAVRLIPERFAYLGAADTATTYGPSGLDDAKDPYAYVGKLALLVGDRYAHRKFTDRIAGLPARIREVSPTGGDTTRWIVDYDYNAKIQISIQVPDSAHLDRASVRAMAKTLDVRDVSHPSHG